MPPLPPVLAPQDGHRGCHKVPQSETLYFVSECSLSTLRENRMEFELRIWFMKKQESVVGTVLRSPQHAAAGATAASCWVGSASLPAPLQLPVHNYRFLDRMMWHCCC
jgi:hypothetical protein